MRKFLGISVLVTAFPGLGACGGYQVKEAAKAMAVETAELAADVFLGIEQPTPEEERAALIMDQARQREHARRVAELTAEYREFIREKREPDVPQPAAVPVVIDSGGLPPGLRIGQAPSLRLDDPGGGGEEQAAHPVE